MGENLEQITEVTIQNQVYHIRSADDPDYVRALGELVDRRMTEISERTQTVDTLKVAILVALNIADQLMSTQRRLAELESEVSLRSEAMLASLEPLLKGQSA